MSLDDENDDDDDHALVLRSLLLLFLPSRTFPLFEAFDILLSSASVRRLSNGDKDHTRIIRGSLRSFLLTLVFGVWDGEPRRSNQPHHRAAVLIRGRQCAVTPAGARMSLIKRDYKNVIFHMNFPPPDVVVGN